MFFASVSRLNQNYRTVVAASSHSDVQETNVSVKSHSQKFGQRPILAVSPLTRLFQFFESSYEPGFILLSKILASVVPRTAITRNWNERQEVLFNELTQGATLFVMLPITSPIANWVQGKFSGISQKLIKLRNEEAIQKALAEGGETFANQLKISKLGKSIGASVFIASLLIATTYWRNYRTIKRTGFSDYKKVVGLGGNVQPTPEDWAQAKVAMKKNLNIIKGLVAGGAAAWFGIMAAAGLIARRGQVFFEAGKLLSPKRMAMLMKHWAFVGKNSNQINTLFKSKWQTLMIWGVPSFLGWFLGCRDRYELIEQTSKFMTFLGGYFLMPMFAQKLMEKKNKKLLAASDAFKPHTYTNLINNFVNNPRVSEDVRNMARKLLMHKNTQWGLLTGMNLLVAGALPLIFNIFFSNWRHKREQQAQQQHMVVDQPAMSSAIQNSSILLRRKPFDSWGARQDSFV